MLPQLCGQQDAPLAVQVLLERTRRQEATEFTPLIVEDAHGAEGPLDEARPIPARDDDQTFVDPPANDGTADERLAQTCGNRQPEAVVETALVGTCQQPALHVPHRTPHLPTSQRHGPQNPQVIPPIPSTPETRGRSYEHMFRPTGELVFDL